jgi:hypothetical protein
MVVEEVFSFPEKYFAEGWLEDKRSEADGRGINKDGTSTNTIQENSSIAVAKSVIPTVTAKNKNEIDAVLLNEFLQSVVE